MVFDQTVGSQSGRQTMNKTYCVVIKSVEAVVVTPDSEAYQIWHPPKDYVAFSISDPPPAHMKIEHETVRLHTIADGRGNQMSIGFSQQAAKAMGLTVDTLADQSKAILEQQHQIKELRHSLYSSLQVRLRRNGRLWDCTATRHDAILGRHASRFRWWAIFRAIIKAFSGIKEAEPTPNPIY